MYSNLCFFQTWGDETAPCLPKEEEKAAKAEEEKDSQMKHFKSNRWTSFGEVYLQTWVMILLMAEILRHPTICGVLYIPGGAGFLPSTLGSYLFFFWVWSVIQGYECINCRDVRVVRVSYSFFAEHRLNFLMSKSSKLNEGYDNRHLLHGVPYDTIFSPSTWTTLQAEKERQAEIERKRAEANLLDHRPWVWTIESENDRTWFAISTRASTNA